MAVTATVLYNLVECPERVALDTFGDVTKRDPTSPFVRLLWERGTLFERETISELNEAFTDLSTANDADRERLTLEAMARGDLLIYGGRISNEDLMGVPDLLRKRTGGYIPGDIKSGRGKEEGSDENDGKPKRHYAVQLALYIDILERLGLSAGRHGFVWDIRGDEIVYDFTSIVGERLWDDYESVLAQARDILARRVKPLPADASVRKLCHWPTFCIAPLTATDDLTLIPFLGRGERDVMYQSFSTITALAESNPGGFITGKRPHLPALELTVFAFFTHARQCLKALHPNLICASRSP
jgi:predicted RecB family nuclease